MSVVPLRFRRGPKPEDKPWMIPSMDGEYQIWHCDLCDKQANEGHVEGKPHKKKVEWCGREYETEWWNSQPAAANTWGHWGAAAAAAAPSTTAASSSSSVVMVETPAAAPPSAGQDPVLIGMPMWFAVALRDALTRAIEGQQRPQG
jgi:hypothetical protein